MAYKYPVYQPSLKGNELKYLTECVETNWLTESGRFVADFEKQFGEFLDIKYTTTVANGTLALHLALVALGIGEGDEVIVPTFTYVATVNAVAYTGAVPVFADSEPEYWQIDPDSIRKKINSSTKAIIPVHLYGHPCQMDKICEIAKEYDLFVIEDAAEAFGTKYKNKYVGTFGDIGVFSFYGNKTITTGEGGMLVTNEKTLFDRAVHFKGQGLAKWRQYWHDVIGYNYRMTNLSAAIGLAQLERANELIEKKRKIASWYKELLSDLPLELQKEAPDAFHTYWMVTVLTRDYETREALRAYLKEKGVETRPTFYPVHTMPMYSGKYQMHRVAENIALRGLNLPSYPDLEKDNVEEICSIVKDFFNKS